MCVQSPFSFSTLYGEIKGTFEANPYVLHIRVLFSVPQDVQEFV